MTWPTSEPEELPAFAMPSKRVFVPVLDTTMLFTARTVELKRTLQVVPETLLELMMTCLGEAAGATANAGSANVRAKTRAKMIFINISLPSKLTYFPPKGKFF